MLGNGPVVLRESIHANWNFAVGDNALGAVVGFEPMRAYATG